MLPVLRAVWQRTSSRRRRPLPTDRRLPTHVGIVMDGNRRWARARRHLDLSVGHRDGAEHLEDFLGWCADRGIEHVSAYVLSADNIRKRDRDEVNYLFELLRTTVPDVLTRPGLPWALHISGDRALLPQTVRETLASAEASTRDRPRHLTLAIGYDGHRDVVIGIRNALRLNPGGPVDPAAISAGLEGGPVKDIDLVIRTSGEMRLSGFFPWQAEHAEIYVSPKMWPAFTDGDLEKALAHYSAAAERLTPA